MRLAPLFFRAAQQVQQKNLMTLASPSVSGMRQSAYPTLARRAFSGDVTIPLPPLAESLTSGEIGEIHVSVGDVVEVDQLLFSVETDKATAPVNAPQAGTVLEILVEVDDNVEVGAPLIKLGPVAEGAAAAKPAAAPAGEAAPAAAAAAAPPPPPAPASGSAPPAAKPAPAPAAKPAAPAAVAAKPAQTGPREKRERLTKIRRVISQRLKDSQNTYAMLTTFQECDMSALFALRKTYGDAFLKKHDVKLGFMSAFVKAAAVALEDSPEVNGVIDGDDVVYRNYVDVSIAVAAPKGLVVPVVRNANEKSFAQIEKDIAMLGAKARNNEIALEDMAGGTFTISNGGVYGSMMGTPIINPPQSAILGMHGITKRAVVVDDKIEIRPMMYLALTYDHRMVDGREGVTFLRRIKHLVEDPTRIVLDV